jgi:hypothetical protein
VLNIANTTQANDALPAHTANCDGSHQCYFYGTSNNVVGLDGCDDTNVYAEGSGICGSVKNLYFVLTLSPPSARAWLGSSILGNEVYMIGGGICVGSSCGNFGGGQTSVVDTLNSSTGVWMTKSPLIGRYF